MSIDYETSVVISSISRFDLPIQPLGGTHMGRVCVPVFIGVSVCALCEGLCMYYVSHKKKRSLGCGHIGGHTLQCQCLLRRGNHVVGFDRK